MKRRKITTLSLMLAMALASSGCIAVYPKAPLPEPAGFRVMNINTAPDRLIGELEWARANPELRRNPEFLKKVQKDQKDAGVCESCRKGGGQ